MKMRSLLRTSKSKATIASRSNVKYTLRSVSSNRMLSYCNVTRC